MNIDDCFLLGKITKPHGYRGDVILYIDADQPDYYAQLDRIWLEIGGRLAPHFLEVQGWTVADAENEKTIGVINKVLDYAMYPILEVLRDGKEVLIPLPPEIDIRVNRSKKHLFATIPEGLLEIYLGASDEATDSLWDGEDEDGEIDG